MTDTAHAPRTAPVEDTKGRYRSAESYAAEAEKWDELSMGYGKIEVGVWPPVGPMRMDLVRWRRHAHTISAKNTT
ncbi:MAG: hypothetical protein AAGI03_04625 [Pseudomonadota bacterium]